MFERRKFVRFALQVIGKGKTLVKVFNVVDISLGGVRLRFLVNEEDVDVSDPTPKGGGL